jgi:hypothetical protein
MPEIIWKRGAEEDLVRIFGDLDAVREGLGERFTSHALQDSSTVCVGLGR